MKILFNVIVMITAFCIGLGVVYAAFAFISMQPDVTSWDPFARVLLVVFGGIVGLGFTVPVADLLGTWDNSE